MTERVQVEGSLLLTSEQCLQRRGHEFKATLCHGVCSQCVFPVLNALGPRPVSSPLSQPSPVSL